MILYDHAVQCALYCRRVSGLDDGLHCRRDVRRAEGRRTGPSSYHVTEWHAHWSYCQESTQRTISLSLHAARTRSRITHTHTHTHTLIVSRSCLHVSSSRRQQSAIRACFSHIFLCCLQLCVFEQIAKLLTRDVLRCVSCTLYWYRSSQDRRHLRRTASSQQSIHGRCCARLWPVKSQGLRTWSVYTVCRSAHSCCLSDRRLGATRSVGLPVAHVLTRTRSHFYIPYHVLLHG